MSADAPAGRDAPRLTRAALAAAEGGPVLTPPVRIVHLGLGAFHRAHQVWYTANAEDADRWGFASVTGRSPHAAQVLERQDGLYTLIERSAQGDVAAIVRNLVEAVDGDDLGRLAGLVAAPATAIVTLTVTEAGYRLDADGLPDAADEVVRGDVALLRDALRAGAAGQHHLHRDPAASHPRSALARLVAGLAARRAAGAGLLAVVPCDNIPDNGGFVRRGLVALAGEVDDALAAWIEGNVSFVSTSVDRITPSTTDADVARARELTGFADAAPVVTEPFSDWVLSGEFPAGRPRWESAGARLVGDIAPFERRKLWLLNGAHSFLAYAGLLAGHRTVAEAVADPALRGGVSQLWAEARAHLREDLLDLDSYTRDLLDRFANARIEHRLEQIAEDGVAKLRVRIAPVAHAERAAGRDAAACARVLAAWVAVTLRGVRPDAQADALRAIVAARSGEEVERLLAVIDPALAQDGPFVDLVRRSL